MNLLRLIITTYIPLITAYQHPIILVPGLGGSVLKNVQNSEKVWPPNYRWIFRKDEWERKMYIDVNTTTGTISYDKLIQSPPLGSRNSVRIVNKVTSWLLGNVYYNRILDYLPTDILYVIPYDFRLVGFDFYLNDLFIRLKTFIEERNEKCDIICHSLGGLVFHLFLLNYVDDTWKEKHISKTIFVNVPFGGAVTTIENMISKELTFNKKVKLNFLENFSGFLWCLPNKEVFKNNTVLVVNGSHYDCESTLSVLPNFCKTSILLTKYLQDKRKLVIKPPIKKCYIIYSVGIETVSKVIVDNKAVSTEYVDGDGVVPTESLLLPKTWNSTVIFIKLLGEHSRILSDNTFLNTLTSILKDELFVT